MAADLSVELSGTELIDARPGGPPAAVYSDGGVANYGKIEFGNRRR